MSNRIHRIRQAPQDRELWQKLYYQHQTAYLRRRLKAIKLLWDGYKLVDVCQELGCAKETLNSWVDLYLLGGFKKLLSRKPSGKKGKGKITGRRLKHLKFIILHKSPPTYGYDGNVWTLRLLSDLIHKKWNIRLKKTRLHDILTKDLGLSHQKFHRDYADAKPSEQRKFVADLQQRIDNQPDDTVLIWYDEFHASTRPQASYGWAIRNSSPTIPSSEKKEKVAMPY